MSNRDLPARPNLEQYKKQAKDLARNCSLGIPDALARMKRHHPRFNPPFSLTDAQLVIAREHNFESWPKFSKHIEMLHLIQSVAELSDPVAAFIEVACVPRHASHGSGTLEHAEMILTRYPEVAVSNIYTAAILGDEAAVRGFVARDPKSATAKGGPHEWDALTHLCFSRYLRIDQVRSEAFVRTARTLLDAGASANTGWYEMIDHPKPRPVLESAIYGAAGIAKHAELTRLLLERGADPNEEETPYHVPEGYDNTVMKMLLESGKLAKTSLAVMLIRKTDWHDADGLELVLEYGGDPNFQAKFKDNALHHSLRRDNGLSMVEMLMEHGADPGLRSALDGRSATELAARRGRADVIEMFERRGIPLGLEGVEALIAACARADRAVIDELLESEPQLVQELVGAGGKLLAEFAGTGNVDGLRCLLDLGVPAAALYREGDGYFAIAKDSTALHVAAWKGWPLAVKELIARGAPVNAVDGDGRTALALAVKACVDSHWTSRRSPDSVDALLKAGATTTGIKIPCGYDAVDELLRSVNA